MLWVDKNVSWGQVAFDDESQFGLFGISGSST